MTNVLTLNYISSTTAAILVVYCFWFCLTFAFSVLQAASSSSNKNIPSSSGCDANQPHCDILRSSSGSKHHRDRGYRSSSSVIGCEASYNRSHRSLDIDDIQEDLAEDAPHSQPGMASHHHHQQHQEQQHHHQHQLQQQQRLETHSCPSSPTETECSSGFSTLRRRSVTLTEKVCVSKEKAGSLWCLNEPPHG